MSLSRAFHFCTCLSGAEGDEKRCLFSQAYSQRTGCSPNQAVRFPSWFAVARYWPVKPTQMASGGWSSG